jgi:hypothetical protein
MMYEIVESTLHTSLSVSPRRSCTSRRQMNELRVGLTKSERAEKPSFAFSPETAYVMSQSKVKVGVASAKYLYIKE